MKRRETHGLGPCYDECSEVLILGSFPSIKSREEGFYYAHPQNRFWPLMEMVFKEEVGKDALSRKEFALKHRLALYDTIESCDIVGSSDASISNVKPAKLGQIIKNSCIRLIILNGKTSEKMFRKYQRIDGVDVITLPSTSPANAKCSLSTLYKVWSAALLRQGGQD